MKKQPSKKMILATGIAWGIVGLFFCLFWILAFFPIGILITIIFLVSWPLMLVLKLKGIKRLHMDGTVDKY